MKLIKLTINRTNKEGRTHYEYPEPYYVANKVIFGPIYEGGLDENAKIARERNLDDEHIIIGVNDEDFDLFMKADGYERNGFVFSAKEYTREQAIEKGEVWTKQQEKIIDQNKVLSILAKSARGEKLSNNEKNSLDPDNKEIGINKTPSFTEDLDKFLNKK